MCFDVETTQTGETVYDTMDKTSSDQAQSRARIETAIKKGLEARERELKADADKRKAAEEEKEAAELRANK